MLYRVVNGLNQLNNLTLKITRMRFFNEIYAAILAIITILGWKFNSIIGMSIIIASAIIALLLTRDLKYTIPNCIYFIFTISEGFKNDSFPIPIIILGVVFSCVILFFSFRKGIYLKKMKSLIGLLGIAIFSIIPIIWCKAPTGNEVFYFFFFGSAGYLLLYMILVNGIKEDSVELLAVSMSFLIIILACECGFKVYDMKLERPEDSILQFWYYLGWGLCNEAGIMVCSALPFVFYLLGKQDKIGGMIYQNFKVIVGIIAIILTTSRGSYLFGLIEVIILYIILLFTAKKTRFYQNAFIIYMISIIIIMLCCRSIIIDELEKVLKFVFTDKMDDSGRKELWLQGINAWKQNPVTILFGSGIICVTGETFSAAGYQLVPIVFHSTIVETLATCGAIGSVFFIIHIIQKYYNAKRCGIRLFSTIGIGYLLVDLYGLIDNTYHMYYYMLPLMVIMAVIDNSVYLNE